MMRLKYVPIGCLILLSVALMLLAYIKMDGFINRTSKSQGWFGSVTETRLYAAVTYPSKSGNATVPIKSPEQIAKLMLKNAGTRVHGVPPDKTVLLKSFDPDEKFKLEENESKPKDLNSISKVMPKLKGENIISMTLYGSDPRYTMGAIKNAELVQHNFPGWKLRLYTETRKGNPRYGIVPQTVIDRLHVLGAEIHFMEPDESLIPPMMWRFLVADDDQVDRFIMRDTDSRLTERDAAAVNEWVKSDMPFHCVRDHPSHARFAISGGMWGAKPKELAKLLQNTWRQMMRGLQNGYLEDMNFLNKNIWPKVSCGVYPNSHPFPIPRHGYEHVGQVFSENDLGRPGDISILRQAGENKNCSQRI